MVTIARNSFRQVRPRSSESYYDREEGRLSEVGESIQRIATAIRRNVRLITAVIVTFIIAASIFTMLQTPRYTALTTIEISNRSDQVLGESLETVGEEVFRGQEDVLRFLNTQVEILNSRSLAERVARRLNLQESPEFFSAMQEEFPHEDLPEAVRFDNVVELLLLNSSTDLSSRTRIAEIGFTSTDPWLSARIVNAFVQEYIELNLQRRFDSSAYARSFVADQLQEARARLEASEFELNTYARKAGLIRNRTPNDVESDASSSVTTESLLQLNRAANEARTQRVIAEAQWMAEKGQPLLSSPSVLASPSVQQLLIRRSALESEIEAARARYFGQHPSIERLEGDLHAAETSLQRAASEARDAVRTKYLASRAAERNLQAQVSALESATLGEQQRSVRYNTLAREADTNRSIFDGLLQRYRELNATAGITASNVSVIDQAVPPRIPSSPNWIINLAVALILGLLFAAAIVYIKEDLDDRVKLPEDIEDKLHLNLLGVIPAIQEDDPLVEFQDSKSVVAEAYGALRSALNFSTREGLPELLLLTSSSASEGKSTSSYALALGMAQTGKRTLLLDADLRRPSIHKKAQTANRYGLSNVLAGEATLNEVLKPSHEPNLFYLTSGPLPPNPAELLSSPSAEALFQSLRERFDIVIVDSAPILGLADTPSLSALVDGVLMVVEADAGRGAQIRASLRRLRLMNANVVGAVLTKFDPEKSGNSHSNYYGYDYYSYRNDEAAA